MNEKIGKKNFKLKLDSQYSLLIKKQIKQLMKRVKKKKEEKQRDMFKIRK